MTGLTVLITNLKLTAQSGTEMYVRDLALELRKRGHRPVVYTPVGSGLIVDELRRATVPVVERLEQIGVVPDVIHGHHAHQTMAALLHFGSTPGIFVCHDYVAWHDEPPLFPRVMRYVAVDDTCWDRLVAQSGIREWRTEVILNAVDLTRFIPRAPLPTRPRRALVFSHLATEDNFFGEIAAACRLAGIDVEPAGMNSGRLLEKPEAVLGDYDLVFAKGKAALEALAMGVAVILCDKMGLGPLVTSSDLDHLRRCNFGRRLLDCEISREAVANRIARYDAADAETVSRRIREQAGLTTQVDHLVALYQRVIDEHAANPPGHAEEHAATARYMERLASTTTIIDSENYRRQNVDLQAEVVRLRQETERLRQSNVAER